MQSRVIKVLTLGLILTGGCAPKSSVVTSNLADIQISELNAQGYDHYTFQMTALEPSGVSQPLKTFSRGQGVIKVSVPTSSYQIVLDYFNQTEKVYSSEYCAGSDHNSQVLLKVGPNNLNINICDKNAKPLDASVTITPVLSPDGSGQQGGGQQPTTPVINQGGGGFVGSNGWLKVAGTQLVNSSGTPVQLKGMSTHGLQWFGSFVNASSFKWLRDDWGITLIRLAAYSQDGGYTNDPNAMMQKVYAGVDAAISLGIYVIVDWHILNDGNPQTNESSAKAFFTAVSQKYGNQPNVIYEICNEPNGGVTWANQIKPYANDIIPIIRNNAPNSIILVGTGSWSQDINDVASSPLSFNNIMYVVHFYSGTHGQWLQDRISKALGQNTPVFITEWGTSQASGDGGPYIDESQQWIDFLSKEKISWANWSLSDKNEVSAILKPGSSPQGGWQASDLSTSGTFVKKVMH